MQQLASGYGLWDLTLLVVGANEELTIRGAGRPGAWTAQAAHRRGAIRRGFQPAV
ncbi:hypothetical protein [Nocardiopsis sp. FIRDI 009]|uniref:hypothetical protein n=1 Tax=Nocardiopsis sp. FIRDI 009 TaxID=714197 RepID=UPI0013006332|nr:hypothetical protein [Nocardiopsis sp. FIRDI 009]